MKDNINTADINKIENLSALIASLPEREQEKLSYIVEGVKMANKSAQEVESMKKFKELSIHDKIVIISNIIATVAFTAFIVFDTLKN